MDWWYDDSRRHHCLGGIVGAMLHDSTQRSRGNDAAQPRQFSWLLGCLLVSVIFYEIEEKVYDSSFVDVDDIITQWIPNILDL